MKVVLEASADGARITREFVTRHGGSVTCSSEPGRGTSFIVDLPAPPPEAARPAR